jgi:hypothetical protein
MSTRKPTRTTSRKQTVTPYDLIISGQWGLYTIAALTKRGRTWTRKHLSGGERTHLNGALVCEGGDRCRAIVAGADKDGLRVEVNGVDMKGFRVAS